jgi:hypothetical protein
MIGLLINAIIQVLALMLGTTVIACMVVMVVRLTIVSWRNLAKAILGSNGRMEPIELAAVITGQLSILMVLLGPLMSYEYDPTIFVTVFTAFCVSTGVYAYKEIKNGKHVTDTKK